MFGTIAFAPRSLAEYAPILGDAAVVRLQRQAEPLHRTRVLHLAVVAFGTALTEQLAVVTPLLQSLGLATEWQVLRTRDEVAAANRLMYAGLCGRGVPWTTAAHAVWESFVTMNAQLLDEPYDVVVIHDPQAAPIIRGGRERQPEARWVFHCHLDLSDTQPDVWAELASSIAAYDAVVFDHPDFLPPGFQHSGLRIIPPGIDPIGPRCMPVPAEDAAAILDRYGLDPERPLLVQAGPLDGESDALGAIAVYDTLAGEFPGLQLLLVATHIYEDAETRAYFDRVVAAAAERPAVTVLANPLQEIGNVELASFQQASNVVLQLGLRHGFGLSIAEAMWKERPVVVGRAGGLTSLVEDGRTGYVTDGAAAERVGELLRDREWAAALGAAGRTRVRERFLVTRVVADYLDLLGSLLLAGATR